MNATNQTKCSYNKNKITIAFNHKIIFFHHRIVYTGLIYSTIDLRLTIIVKHLRTQYFPIGELVVGLVSVGRKAKNVLIYKLCKRKIASQKTDWCIWDKHVSLIFPHS